MLPEITEKVRPPRSLAVPYPLGFPLGGPDAPDLQRAILQALLALCRRDDVPVFEQLTRQAGSSSD